MKSDKIMKDLHCPTYDALSTVKFWLRLKDCIHFHNSVQIKFECCPFLLVWKCHKRARNHGFLTELVWTKHWGSESHDQGIICLPYYAKCRKGFKVSAGKSWSKFDNLCRRMDQSGIHLTPRGKCRRHALSHYMQRFAVKVASQVGSLHTWKMH